MESPTYSYIRELSKVKTLDEIAAQASVEKSYIEELLQDPTLNAHDFIFKPILSMWCREVYLKKSASHG